MTFLPKAIAFLLCKQITKFLVICKTTRIQSLL
nr:MAG TPA: hypothetical protein [Caudoviricetes sp.]